MYFRQCDEITILPKIKYTHKVSTNTSKKIDEKGINTPHHQKFGRCFILLSYIIQRTFSATISDLLYKSLSVTLIDWDHDHSINFFLRRNMSWEMKTKRNVAFNIVLWRHGDFDKNVAFAELKEKKEEIWLRPMTKAPTEKSKRKCDNTKTPPKTSITQWLQTDLGRSAKAV